MIDMVQNRQYCDRCIAKYHLTSPPPCQRCTIGADGLPTEYVHEAGEEDAFGWRFQPVQPRIKPQGSDCWGCVRSGSEACKECVVESPGKMPTMYDNQSKPPLGLVPRRLHDSRRVGEILEALSRYNEAGKPVPQEWLDELNEKIKKEESK